MVKIRKAPAGYIAQLMKDETVSGIEMYAGATGKWSKTENEAIETLMVDIERQKKRLKEAYDKAHEEYSEFISCSKDREERT